MSKAKKKYKDTVFRMLFGKRERALELYNGVNGTDYDNPELLEFNTLENAIYMNIHNDLSFLIANQVNLYEHQSTLPANMPERIELKLSDSFAVLTDNPSLELKVTVLNINPGMNEELKKKCPDLNQYMLYVEKVRTYASYMKLEDAVEKAVDECIRSDILRDFLIRQKAEVVKVSIYEFDTEREMKLIREDEREIGQERITELYRRLKNDDRMDDLLKAIDDKGYQDILLKEYGI